MDGGIQHMRKKICKYYVAKEYIVYTHSLDVSLLILDIFSRKKRKKIYEKL